ncbi:hypothetical protein JCM10207_004635 [Rhodosporidiobolus poonsookiae]
MAAPLGHAQIPNVPSHRPLTRAASALSKQVVLDPPREGSEDDLMDDDEDSIVLAQVPSRSQDAELSSQTRQQLARAGSSAFDGRFSEAPRIDTDEEAAFNEAYEQALQHGMSTAEAGEWASNALAAPGAFADEDEVFADEEEEEEEEEEDVDDSRSEGELQAIGMEMDGLERAVPGLLNKYRLVDRLGEGTFSSVYKAIDLQHHSFDNSKWQPADKKGKVYVAIKRIYVTSSPIRIHNELEILHDLRGSGNVAYLIDAIRHEDQVLAVMPYNRHQDFRSYYRTATLPLLRSYFSCLLRALCSTHNLHIIHRDVKPANFLYDVTTGQGTLCDYGLAQKIGGDEWYEWKSGCLHSLPGPTWGGIAGRQRSQAKMKAAPCCPGLSSGLHGVRLPKPLSLYEQAIAMEKEWKTWAKALGYGEDDCDATDEERELLEKSKPWIMPDGWRVDIKQRMLDLQTFNKSWRPATEVMKQKAKQKPGVLKDDRRPSIRANRAGTRGFRAPEILFKCPDQTVSIDIWSVGIMLLCFLTRRFPFFNSNDDNEALSEITAIFGKKKMAACAAMHNRTFQCNIAEYDEPPHANLHELVRELNPPIMVENSPDPYGPIPASTPDINKWYQGSDLYQAIDLMKRCLELDCTKRWTAEECLEHAFFRGEYDLGLGRTVYRENGKET